MWKLCFVRKIHADCWASFKDGSGACPLYPGVLRPVSAHLSLLAPHCLWKSVLKLTKYILGETRSAWTSISNSPNYYSFWARRKVLPKQKARDGAWRVNRGMGAENPQYPRDLPKISLGCSVFLPFSCQRTHNIRNSSLDKEEGDTSQLKGQQWYSSWEPWYL